MINLSEMHLKNLVLLIVHVAHSLKTKNELKTLCRLEIQILFAEMSSIRPVFNMIWFMVNQKTCQKELSQTKVLRDKAFKTEIK